MKSILFVSITIFTVASCVQPNKVYINKINSLSSEKLMETKIIPRGTYILFQSQYNNKSYSCNYYLTKDEFKFSSKMDSIFENKIINKDCLELNFREKINIFLSSNATYLEGNSNRISYYYDHKNVYVKFLQKPDSEFLKSYFGNEKYELLDSVFYCKAKKHLKRY